MKKIVKEYEVYNFNELSEEIKEKLIEKQVENDFEFYCEYQLKEDMEYCAEELLKKYFGDKVELKNVYYSLSYCQGDGAMIEFNGNYYGEPFYVKQNGYYYHSRSFTIEEYGLTEKQYNQLREKIIKMNEELEKTGWKLVDIDNHKQLLRESAIDCLSTSDFQYLKNGELFN